MAEPKSNIRHQNNIQFECSKFDIAIPMERGAVVEYLLYNEHRVDPNWLIGKVRAARTLNYEKFYEDIPNSINVVNETIVETPIHEKESAGHYKEWKGKVLIELDMCYVSYAGSLHRMINDALHNVNYGHCRKLRLTNLHDIDASVSENKRFPDNSVFFNISKDDFVYVNRSKGVVEYYIDLVYQTYPFHKHDEDSCLYSSKKQPCTIIDDQNMHYEKEVEFKAALRGLKKVLALRHSPNAYTYGMYTRSTFEREYNLTWIPENKE